MRKFLCEVLNKHAIYRTRVTRNRCHRTRARSEVWWVRNRVRSATDPWLGCNASAPQTSLCFPLFRLSKVATSRKAQRLKYHSEEVMRADVALDIQSKQCILLQMTSLTLSRVALCFQLIENLQVIDYGFLIGKKRPPYRTVPLTLMAGHAKNNSRAVMDGQASIRVH